MFNCFIKIGVAAAICLSVGCSQANNKPVSINFTSDSTAFRVEGVNPVGLLELRHQQSADTLTREWIWVNCAGKKLPGRLQIKEDILYFYPEAPLEKGKTYTVSTLLNTSFGAPSQVLKGQVSYQVKPQQQVLVR